MGTWEVSMDWERDGFASHKGAVGVLLADGSEPGPAYFDTGSGSYVHESTAWFVYDGTLRASTATRMRGKCSCGWRGENTYHIDWEEVCREDPYAYDTSGPSNDWATHLDEVEALTVPLPEAVTELLRELRAYVERLVDDSPLAALKVVNELETITAWIGPTAASFALRGDELPWSRIAEGLGMTEPDARSRLFRYERLS
ncbi:hypothetical protein J7E96_08795 [Streptomyces sp. ISL-96]|uniref:hypothetical protein n=1 Tax=Streptomyces sp. ISL-96 TaxID=2819191 RepID=UPI001BED0664|nr:hypothetical protein [Streptomyces sp. ISL-96]MBT2488619.1 hypothetical protein [Streptomyces sp. ISL-96]